MQAPQQRPLTVQEIDERIRDENWYLRAIAQWRTPDPQANWHVLVKDNIAVKDLRTTAGSYAFKALKATQDAFCISRLRVAGANPFGKTTMSELAGFVSSTMPMGYSELGGQGVNPLDETLSPGGSSSGSAIAVAAGFCDAAVGTETHGSIVFPAHACGIVGFKPTVGVVSRSGIVPISHSLDTPGALARNVSDAAKLVAMMAGIDPDDPATIAAPNGFAINPQPHITSDTLRLALLVPKTGFEPAVQKALTRLKEKALAHAIEIVDAPLLTVETHYKTISSTEIQTDMDRFLAKWGNGQTPSNFAELVRFYEMRELHHPWGVNRLTDALTFDPDLTNPVYQTALTQGTGAARGAIDETLKAVGAQAIVAVGFVPWWAVGQTPYVALPLTQLADKSMIGITVGARCWEDNVVLSIAARLEKLLKD